MRALEDFMNRLSDMDSGWWPFLHVRPQKDKPMDNSVLLKMSACYGPLYGLVLGLLAAIGIQQFSLWVIVGNIVLISVVFFPLYKFTFAILWNRRARRLQASSESDARVQPTPESGRG